MTTLDAATQTSLQNALYAYINKYGDGESISEIRAIAGSILSAKEKARELVAEGMEIEAWVNELVENFDPSRAATQFWSAGEQAIATQAKHWREKLETKTQATLDAYIQKYAPDLNTTKIQGIVATILPVVEDAQISRDEATRLIHHVSSQFDWQAAASRVIDPKWVMLADKTMQCIQNRALEGTVQDVMHAYIQKFQPTLVEVGEGLIEQAVKSVLNSKLQLDLDVGIDAETQRLLIKQVALKLKLMEADPVPSKTALQFAQEIHDEVARYRQEQGMDEVSYIPEVIHADETSSSSSLGGEMSIGIDILPSRPRPQPPTANH